MISLTSHSIQCDSVADSTSVEYLPSEWVYYNAEFAVLTAAFKKSEVFWDTMPFKLVIATNLAVFKAIFFNVLILAVAVLRQTRTRRVRHIQGISFSQLTLLRLNNTWDVFSTLKSVKTFSSTTWRDHLSDLAMLSVEKGNYRGY